MDVYEWLEVGVEAGFCTPPFCQTHDGPPDGSLDEETLEELEAGGDPCVHVILLLGGS